MTLSSLPSFTVKVKVAYVAPFALAAGAHVSFARLAVVTVLPLAMADSPPLTAPLSSESTHSVPAEVALKCYRGHCVAVYVCVSELEIYAEYV